MGHEHNGRIGIIILLFPESCVILIGPILRFALAPMTIVPESFTPDIFSLSIPVPALDIVILTVHEGDLCVVTTATVPGAVDDYFQKLPSGILRTGE